MRVIAGEAKGRRLKTLEGLDVRPTTDKVKESLFSILQFDLPGCRFLDLFSGSGQIGIEALSRGAHFAVLNDQSRSAQAVIRENLETVGFEKRAKVIAMDALAYLSGTREQFDIVFLDPPYHRGILEQVLPLAAERTSPAGIIVCEHEANEQLPQQVGSFVLQKQYRYGKIMLSKYTVPVQEEDF